MRYVILTTILALSTQIFALDEETQFLPTHAKDVTQSHKNASEIKQLISEFVISLESKDKNKFKSLVTAYFLEASGWDKEWKRLSATVSPKLAQIQDVFLMDHKGKTYVRFTVHDPKQNKSHTLPSKTWYRVKSVNGVWKMDAYLPNFNPDGDN